MKTQEVVSMKNKLEFAKHVINTVAERISKDGDWRPGDELIEVKQLSHFPYTVVILINKHTGKEAVGVSKYNLNDKKLGLSYKDERGFGIACARAAEQFVRRTDTRK
jgi:hypothetical protein